MPQQFWYGLIRLALTLLVFLKEIWGSINQRAKNGSNSYRWMLMLEEKVTSAVKF